MLNTCKTCILGLESREGLEVCRVAGVDWREGKGACGE